MSNFPPGAEFDSRAPFNEPTFKPVTVEVIVYKESKQFEGSINNFTVQQKYWDIGDVTGYGSTLEKAIEDYESGYLLKYDEVADVVVIQTIEQ